MATAVDQGAELIVLPELFHRLGPLTELLPGAEDLDGPSLSRVRELACEYRVHVCAGSICQQMGDRGSNTTVFFAPDGTNLATYRKIHLFEIDWADRVQLCESEIMQPGREVVVCDCDLGKVGFATCYDLRFPELFRALVDRGAEIICFPSAFTLPTGKAHWHTLLKARAIENQFFVLAANQVGRHAEGLESYGHSMIVDPWGNILAEEIENIPAVVTCEINSAQLKKIRQQLPALRHRVNFLQ